jgi:hypothetical protein
MTFNFKLHHYQRSTTHTVFLANHSMCGVHNKLTATGLALVILLAIVNVAILLELQRPTFGSGVQVMLARKRQSVIR